MGSEPWIVLIVVLFIFFVRGYRVPSSGGGIEEYVHQMFYSTSDKTLRFSGENMQVLISKVKLKRFAKSSFFEAGCPFVAVKLCKDKSDRHFLWTYRRPEDAFPHITLLNVAEAREMLNDEDGILAKVFPEEA